MDDDESELVHGEVPVGIGPEVFRERLEQVARDEGDRGAEMTLHGETVAVADIESVEGDPDGHRSHVRLRNGLIIGGVTGAAIVAAIATIRYRRRHRS